LLTALVTPQVFQLLLDLADVLICLFGIRYFGAWGGDHELGFVWIVVTGEVRDLVASGGIGSEYGLILCIGCWNL